MRASGLLQPLLLLLLVGSIDAYVYSCEEVRYQWINSDRSLNTTFICIVTQEGYSKWDQLKKIGVADYATSLADIGDPSGCFEKRPKEPSWRLIAEAGFNLDCGQEITLIFTSEIPTLQLPTKGPRERRITTRDTFVTPHTYTWYHTESCLGDGLITFATGVGRGMKEEQYDLKTWHCWDIPDWIFSFDVVNTIYMTGDVTLNVQYSSDPGGSYHAPEVEKSENIVVITSGRADDVQNTNGKTDNRAFIQIGNYDLTEVNMDMYNNMDTDNRGSVAVQKEWGGTTFNYYNGTHSERFETGYFEVRWEPSGKDGSEIWNSQDFMYVDIWIGPKQIRSSPTVRPTTTTPRPTTRAPRNTKDPYCNCAVDQAGAPVDWKYNDIWLDVVVILDTSEAMGASSLTDASSLVESFVGSLSTGLSNQFYTRVGVIAMADKATVLYNLNMTNADKVKASVKKGLKQIDVNEAFTAAQQMLADSPSKVNARQVIYFLTDTDPSLGFNPFSLFKQTGVVVVSNFLQAGEEEKDNLKELASYGYYFSDTNSKITLQSFCKANCFCKTGKDALAGNDPATPSAGGCYHPSPSAVAFSKAKTTCANDGGIIAVVHDDVKGKFVDLEVAKTGTKSDYYWIGYEKSGNAWRWQDQSTDPYTNWDKNEPSTSSVATCAYADKSKWNLPWGASNCQLAFPYVCEFPPCAVGNRNC